MGIRVEVAWFSRCTCSSKRLSLLRGHLDVVCGFKSLTSDLEYVFHVGALSELCAQVQPAPVHSLLQCAACKYNLLPLFLLRIKSEIPFPFFAFFFFSCPRWTFHEEHCSGAQCISICCAVIQHKPKYHRKALPFELSRRSLGLFQQFFSDKCL